MIKDETMDYATNAFRRYASLGKPTRKIYEDRIRNDVYKRLSHFDPAFIIMSANAAVSKNISILEDIEAVEKTFGMLNANGRSYIVDAVSAIYMVCPEIGRAHV